MQLTGCNPAPFDVASQRESKCLQSAELLLELKLCNSVFLNAVHGFTHVMGLERL